MPLSDRIMTGLSAPIPRARRPAATARAVSRNSLYVTRRQAPLLGSFRQEVPVRRLSSLMLDMMTERVGMVSQFRPRPQDEAAARRLNLVHTDRREPDPRTLPGHDRQPLPLKPTDRVAMLVGSRGLRQSVSARRRGVSLGTRRGAGPA